MYKFIINGRSANIGYTHDDGTVVVIATAAGEESWQKLRDLVDRANRIVSDKDTDPEISV